MLRSKSILRDRSGKAGTALRRAVGAMICGLVAMLAAPAYAQYANSCGQFWALASSADPGLMQQLSGVWQTEDAARPGTNQRGPAQITNTRYPEGTLQSETYRCYFMPGLGESCTTEMSDGNWFAHRDRGGGIVFDMRTESAANRGRPNCVSIHLRFLDENTTENEYAGLGHRVGPAR